MPKIVTKIDIRRIHTLEACPRQVLPVQARLCRRLRYNVGTDSRSRLDGRESLSRSGAPAKAMALMRAATLLPRIVPPGQSA